MSADDWTDPEGAVRRGHYGPGRQPWDVIVEAGWGAEFAASNVLKYLRRTKEPEHSRISAAWYWRQLCVGAGGGRGAGHGRHARFDCDFALQKLRRMLTPDELASLER